MANSSPRIKKFAEALEALDPQQETEQSDRSDWRRVVLDRSLDEGVKRVDLIAPRQRSLRLDDTQTAARAGNILADAMGAGVLGDRRYEPLRAAMATLDDRPGDMDDTTWDSLSKLKAEDRRWALFWDAAVCPLLDECAKLLETERGERVSRWWWHWRGQTLGHPSLWVIGCRPVASLLREEAARIEAPEKTPNVPGERANGHTEINQPADMTAETSLPPDAMLSPATLAEKFQVPLAALQKCLERWRAKNADGWQEVTNRKPREPQYLYRLEAVRAVIEEMRSKTDG